MPGGGYSFEGVEQMFEYEAKILHVVDGDTIKMMIDLGFYTWTEQIIRLARIDAPDVLNWGAKGINDPARDYIMSNLPVGSVCVVRISRREKYGRFLGEVIFKVGEIDRHAILRDPRVLNDELVRSGLAKPYNGGKK
jgi:micrococcal nuclease